ncbi:response regulator [Polyangium spumosum]|uniref:Response regulator n=1 Tax=Polyangium spumosum TaxID=889282 RepID=A0A6N7PJ87_9BACT|nr:response regulator [Polyangium spumosum]MRG92059.1 response regulator [Polyangium spumosum]
MARILVIEDEPALLKVLDYNFRQAGHEVLLAPRGEEGLRLARERRPDVILLDLMLPDLQGTEVCLRLQQSEETRDMPVVIVSARGDEVDRVVGFELGAVDYVVKPFSVRELLLRVQAILRRAKAKTGERRVLQFGRLRIDDEAHRVWVDGAEVELTLLEFKLLVALYENRERVQTRGALLEGVWGMDVEITTRTVDTHVKRLRDKLGPAGDYVQTVRGIGYRFGGDPDMPGSHPD